ncbi:hypothetical protein Hypma_015432 [Hypsizygus marmoreus]|uniref:Uncharacterized protein n=1 Tax=Hypsizygus marmoreus TaxID=39966 RepID=A0A369K7I7_HYPMA|nr:hypothetical protein Hypma_015432 [Hypsizygus marmoreus]
MPDLRYNVRWVEQTFHTRAATEALLSPERENGNLTSHDYDAAAAFFPGFHRHYRLVGGVAAIPLLYTVRKPTWSNARSYIFLTTASFAGFVIGHALSLTAHFNFVRSIENPDGFSQAMDNIQKNTGSFAPQGPVIVRQGRKIEVDHDPDAPPLDSSPTPAPSSAPTDSLTPIKPATKWDEIRALNARAASNSSWDALRQRHERARVPAPSSSPSEDDFERTRGDDRAAEQARFDELLEKERHMK